MRRSWWASRRSSSCRGAERAAVRSNTAASFAVAEDAVGELPPHGEDGTRGIRNRVRRLDTRLGPVGVLHGRSGGRLAAEGVRRLDQLYQWLADGRERESGAGAG